MSWADDTRTVELPIVEPKPPRVVGVDVARGLALIGMLATHVFETFNQDGDPSLPTVVAGGRAATTFVLIAGVSLVFLAGGRTPLRGKSHFGVSTGLLVRSSLIGATGLALGALAGYNQIDGILPVYGLLFLLAIPLLACPTGLIVGIAAASVIAGPVLIVATARAGLTYSDVPEPTFGGLVGDPLGLLLGLFLTGAYPAVVYLGYLCAGLAIGRLDLRSNKVAWALCGGGLTVAVAARAVSFIVLYRWGGLDALISQSGLSAEPAAITSFLWEPEPTTSWWYLAVPGPHAHTPVDMVHTMGSAAAVLGAALLVTRLPAAVRVLSPLAAAGSMSFTLYSAHLVLLATGVAQDDPLLLFLSMVVGGLALAHIWRWRFRQGPLEAVVARSATSARRALTARFPVERPSGLPWGVPSRPPAGAARRVAQVLAPVVCAVVLIMWLWAGSESVTAPADRAASDAAVSETSEDDPGESFDAESADEPDVQPPSEDGEGQEESDGEGQDTEDEPQDESDEEGPDASEE